MSNLELHAMSRVNFFRVFEDRAGSGLLWATSDTRRPLSNASPTASRLKLRRRAFPERMVVDHHVLPQPA